MDKLDERQYIIAIGASAGGLEAIDAFFDHTPMDGVSYVVIQHLSADFKSQMVHILSRHSKLEVIEVTDQLEIASNKVYLIPSTKIMTIKSGKLFLSDKKNKPRPYMTINSFFTSLAQERGNKAIGIVLSGTGNDGTLGVEGIKKAGGMVIVQDPTTATFKEMPISAIATACADIILSPKDMPKAIEDYINGGLLEVLDDEKNEEINRTVIPAVRQLEQENERLKRIIAKRIGN
jgi:two-component system CheB/CheR fusion protein